MYNKDFAIIYNKEWSKFSETMAENVLKITPCRDSVLDLGCGTGNFLKRLEKHFKRTVGIDISENMIAIARKNCKRTDFFIKSVTDFKLNEKFDLITCNFDMINHLDTIKDWEKMFKLAYKHLNNDGIFLFDINTIFKFKKLDFIEHTRENENYKFISKDTKIDENHVRMNIQVFDKNGKKVAYVDEVESFYDEEKIKASLNNAGFNNIKFADMDLNEVDNFDVSRLFIICKK